MGRRLVETTGEVRGLETKFIIQYERTVTPEEIRFAWEFYKERTSQVLPGDGRDIVFQPVPGFFDSL